MKGLKGGLRPLNLNGRQTYLDELVVPVIFSLNLLGYKTQYSCEGHYYPGQILYPYILFKNTKENKKLLKKLIKKKSLKNIIIDFENLTISANINSNDVYDFNEKKIKFWKKFQNILEKIKGE